MPKAYHTYSNSSKHFQRQERTNVGIIEVCYNKWFRIGYKDFVEGNEYRELGMFCDGKIMAQSAYELGRLFAAYCKGSNIVIKKWYKSTGSKGWLVSNELVSNVRKARKIGVFC